MSHRPVHAPHRAAVVRRGLLAAGLLVTACSVSQPRHEVVASGFGAEEAGPGDVTGGVDGQADSSRPGGPSGDAPGGPAAGTNQPRDGRDRGSLGDGTTLPTTRAPDEPGGPLPPEVGVGNDTIVVSVAAPFSGPVGAIANQLYEGGIATWVDDVNARGGIHGRKVVVKKVDDPGTVDGGVAACKEAQSNGSFLVLKVPANDATVSCLDDAGIPVFAASQGARGDWRLSRPLFFEPDRGRVAANFVGRRLDLGGKKLGVIHVDAQNYAAVKDGYVARAKELGMNVVAVEAVQRAQASFTSELLRLRQAGAEHVLVAAELESIGIMRDARALGYDAHFTGVGEPCLDEFSQAGRETFAGMDCVRWFATFESPRYDEWRAKAQQYGKTYNNSTSGFAYYGIALVLEQLLESFGPDPRRANAVAAFETVRNFDSGAYAPVGWAPDRFVGVRAMYPVVCCDAEHRWKLTGPPSDTF